MYTPRAILPPLLLFGVANAAYTCVDFTVPVSYQAVSYPPSFPPFENHYQSVAFLNGITSRDALSAPSPLGDPVNITIDAEVAAQYCHPTHGHVSDVVQVLTHGIGFDHSYWDFGGPDSEYNYIKVATDSGYSTLSYDRLGTGKSTKLNPYSQLHLGVEASLLGELTTLLRSGKLSKYAGTNISTPKKVVHVGHSYGSAISHTLVGSAPSLSDGVVLTGYSTLGQVGGTYFAVSSNLHLAVENDPARFGDLSKGYLTWGDELSNQYSFFYYPKFDPKVLHEAEATKQPFGLGEFLTFGNAPKLPGWKKPLLVRLRCDGERS